MSFYSQNATIVGIAKQTGKGTANDTPEVQLWLAGNSVVAPVLVKADIAETHGYLVPHDAYIESIEVKGDNQHFVMPVSIGEFFNAILGRDTKTGSGDPYTHTIDWGASSPTTLPYYTMLVASFGSLYGESTDLRLNHLKLEGKSNGLLMVTCSWVGGVPQFRTTTVLTASSVEKTARMRFADGHAALKLGGSALPYPQSFTLDIDRGLTVVPSDTQTPDNTAAGAFSATLALTYTADGFALFNHTVYGADSPSDTDPATINPYTLGGSPAGIDFKFTQAASPERSLEILMPNVQVDPFSDQPSTTPGPLVRTVNVKAYGPSDGSSPLTAVVLNGQATAY
jgi:Phage tail tube protein